MKITNKEESLEAVKNAVRALKYVPEKHKTQEQYLEAVKNFAKVVYGEKLITRELFSAVLDNIGEALEVFPESISGEMNRILESAEQDAKLTTKGAKTMKITNEEEALDAVRKNGKALNRVPKNLRTMEVCREAVKKDGCALYFVPDELWTASPKKLGALCFEAVKQNALALIFVPKNLITAELCLQAVKKDGSALNNVPKNLRTAEVCRAAVKQYGWALQFVPRNLKTTSPKEFGAICLEAVKQRGSALEYVPKNLRTMEVCRAAVKQYAMMLEYVPRSLRTASPKEFGALCLEAVKQSGFALRHVPANLKTAELCLQAVKTVNRNVFELVPEALRDEVFRALKNGNLLHLKP